MDSIKADNQTIVAITAAHGALLRALDTVKNDLHGGLETRLEDITREVAEILRQAEQGSPLSHILYTATPAAEYHAYGYSDPAAAQAEGEKQSAAHQQHDTFTEFDYMVLPIEPPPA